MNASPASTPIPINEAEVLKRLAEMETHEPGFWEKQRLKGLGPREVVDALMSAGRAQGISVITMLHHQQILLQPNIQQAIAGYLGLT